MSGISRRELLTGAGAITCAAPAVAQRRRQSASWEPPNILMIVADDLAAWMCGCYGNQEIKTPNIDLLARLGTRFSTSYTVAPVGPASRATLYTGRTPAQHGVRELLRTGAPGQTSTREVTLPDSFANETMVSDVLSQRGWRCGYIGKWGMGESATPGHGYDFTYTMLEGPNGYRDPVMARNGERVEETGYLTELMTDAAGGFLDEQNPDERFFLAVNYPNPNTPYEGHPQRYYDLYSETSFETIGYRPAAPNADHGKEMLDDPVHNLRRCAASVSALDDQIAILLNKLREREVWSDTLIVFTSDTGQLLGRHGLWGDGLASKPVNMYEEVMRVPLIWAWPGEVPIEATRPEQVSVYDLLPSMLEACQVSPPTDGNRYGRSYFSLSTGGLWREQEPWPVHLYGAYEDAEVVRDRRYKLVLRNRGEGPSELYDLRTDPREARNEFDNARFTVVREGLTERLAEWRDRYSS